MGRHARLDGVLLRTSRKTPQLLSPVQFLTSIEGRRLPSTTSLVASVLFPSCFCPSEEFEMPLYLVRFTRVIEEDQSPSKSACPHVKATVSVPEEGTREAAPFRAVSQGSAPGLLRTCSVPAPVCSETAPGAPSSSCVVPQNSPLLPRGYRGRGGLFSRRAAAAAAALERPSSDTDLPSSISASAAVGDWSTTPVPRGNERLSGGRLRQDELGASACGVQKATLVSSDSTRSTYSSGASAVEENLSEPENLDNGVSKFPFSCSTALSASSESSGSSSEKRERPSVSPADSGSAARGPAPSSVCPDGDDDREERLNSLFSRCPPFPSSRPSRVADASASPHHAVQDSAADRDLGTAGEALGVIVADSEETGSRGNTCPSSSPQEREALNFETSLDTGSGEDQSGNTKEPQVLSEREELERGVLEALAADCLVEEAVIPLSSCLPACLFPGTSPWVGGLANRRFSFSWGEELKADILSLNAMHREKRQQRMLATWRSSCIRSDTREGLPFQSDGTKAKESDDEDDPSCSRFLSRRSIVHGIEDSFDESLLFLSLFKSDASGNALDLSDDTPDALMKESDFGKEEESAEGPGKHSCLNSSCVTPLTRQDIPPYSYLHLSCFFCLSWDSEPVEGGSTRERVEEHGYLSLGCCAFVGASSFFLLSFFCSYSLSVIATSCKQSALFWERVFYTRWCELVAASCLIRRISYEAL